MFLDTGCVFYTKFNTSITGYLHNLSKFINKNDRLMIKYKYINL